MQPFLAMITPVQSGGGQPPYPTTGPGFPTNPIAGMGPGGNFPGGAPPVAGWGPGFPTNPIYGFGPGGNFPTPPGIWGGGGVGDYIDAGFPGPQPGRPPQIWGGPYFPPIASTGPGFPTNPIVIPVPPNTPGAPPEGGMVAVIPAGTTLVSSQEISVPNPVDPEHPYVIPAGTVIITSQAILVPTGYAPPAAQPPVATPQKK